jgi:cupin 2 domain-containing protein
MGNLFSNTPTDIPDEIVEVLTESPHVRVERIVSAGHASPDGFWFDQEKSEWVLLLRGEAKLQFAGESSSRYLTAGDYLLIPAHKKHRVEWTTPHGPTIWLAVHYDT